MNQPRRYTRRQSIYQSNQEASIHSLYPNLTYHPKVQLHYVIDYVYRPDFYVGRDYVTGKLVYIEAKEYFTEDLVNKYVSICRHNSGIILLLIVKTMMTDARKRLDISGVDNLYVYVTSSMVPSEWLLRCRTP